MPRRLSQLYPIGHPVEIKLERRDGQQQQWVPGRVVDHDFPGIWVATEEGGRWFVTNHRRIRMAGSDREGKVGC